MEVIRVGYAKHHETKRETQLFSLGLKLPNHNFQSSKVIQFCQGKFPDRKPLSPKWQNSITKTKPCFTLTSKRFRHQMDRLEYLIFYFIKEASLYFQLLHLAQIPARRTIPAEQEVWQQTAWCSQWNLPHGGWLTWWSASAAAPSAGTHSCHSLPGSMWHLRYTAHRARTIGSVGHKSFLIGQKF